MIDPHGEEWLPVDEVLDRLPHLSHALLRQWSSRGVVRTYRVSQRRWLSMVDVLDRERDARQADWQPGRRSSQLKEAR